MKRMIMILIVVLMISACTPTEKTSSETTKLPNNPSNTPRPTAFHLPFPKELEKYNWTPPHFNVMGNLSHGYLYRASTQTIKGIDIGPNGRLWVSDWTAKRVYSVGLDGSLEVLEVPSQFKEHVECGPRDLVFDSVGNLYITSCARIFKIDPEGLWSEIDVAFEGHIEGLTIDANDNLIFSKHINEGGAGRYFHPRGQLSVADGVPFASDLEYLDENTLILTQHFYDQVVIADIDTGEQKTIKTMNNSEEITVAISPDMDIWLRGNQFLTRYGIDGGEKPWYVERDDGQIVPGPSIWWNTPGGITFDEEGSLWVGSYDSRLRFLELIGQEPDGPVFKVHLILPGLTSSGMDVDSNGNIYLANENKYELWKISPLGEITVLDTYNRNTRVAVAINSKDEVFFSFVNWGEIAKLESDGSLSHYADLVVQRMVFGVDDVLYASVGTYNEPKIIYRITDIDTYEIFSEGDGERPFGSKGLHIARALDDGFYLFSEETKLMYIIDYEGNVKYIQNMRSFMSASGDPIALMGASPVEDRAFFVAHATNYGLLQIKDRENVGSIGSEVWGDPWALAVSRDGNWLYVVESGAIDMIEIPGRK